MPRFRTKSFKGVLLSALVVTSMFASFILYFSNSKIVAAPKFPDVIRASGPFTVTSYPIADAYVQEGYPTTNYGTDYRVYVRSRDYPGTGGYGQERAFYKFSLENIPTGSTITSAVLYLHCYYINYYVHNVVDVEIRSVADDSWSETTINWDNQPAYGSVLADYWILDNASWDGSHSVDNWYENDITSYVESQFASGDTTISLCLKCMQEYYDNLQYRYTAWYTKEVPAVENRPTLIVTYAQPLEHGVSVRVSPDNKDNVRGSTSSFLVTVTNIGSNQENYLMTMGDNGNNWALALTGDALTADNKLENVISGDSRILTLTATIPDNVTPFIRDNIWVKATSLDNTDVTDNDFTILRCIPEQAVTGTASVRLAFSEPAPYLWGTRKVSLTLNLTINYGDNLLLKFLSYDNNTAEVENVVWNRSVQGHENVSLTGLVVPHPENVYVERVKLVLTDSTGAVVMDNMAWYTVVQDDWYNRITWIILHWGGHNSSQQDQLSNEITQIIIYWLGCPSTRDQNDFSQYQ
jgi:hypothetical protein